MCSCRLPNLQSSRKVRSPAPPAFCFIPPKHPRFATEVDLRYFVFSSTIEYERCENVSYLQLPSFYHSAISCRTCGIHFTRPVFPKSKHSHGVRQYVKLGNRGFRESWPLSEQGSLSAVPLTPRVSHCASFVFQERGFNFFSALIPCPSSFSNVLCVSYYMTTDSFFNCFMQAHI